MFYSFFFKFMVSVTEYRRRATALATVGGGLAMFMPRWQPHLPDKFGAYQPYTYKAWHGGTEVAYKKYKYGKLDSSSSNAPKNMAPVPKRRAPATPPDSARRGAPRRRVVVQSVSVPVRRQAARKVKKINVNMSRVRRVGKRRYPPRRTRGGVLTSVSSGYFSTPRGRRHTLDRYAKLGYVIACEQGGTITTTAAAKANSVMIAHSTFSKPALVNVVAYAMAKMLAIKINRCFTTYNDRVSNIGTKLTIYYRSIPTGAISNFNFTFVAASTWLDIVSQLTAWLNLTSSDSTIWAELVFEERTISTDVNQYIKLCHLDLSRAKFHIYAKANLKLQNQTKGATSESDVVDNVPLFGKSYQGTGNYFMYKNDKPVIAGEIGDYEMFVTTGFNCVFTDSFNSVDNLTSLREPPPKSMFVRVKTDGKAHLDPGSIKTSTMTDYLTVSMANLLRIISGVNLSESQTNAGKFRFFLLEKMLQYTATTDANAINVAYEHDIKHGCICVCSKITPSHFEVVNIPL